MKDIFSIPEVVATWTDHIGQKVIGVIKKFPDTADNIKSALGVPRVSIEKYFRLEEVGEIFAPPPGDIKTDIDRTKYIRPAPGGVSIGHKDITAGTLGMLVQDKETGEILILSNNHILANSNDAKIGDRIMQPGPHDLENGDDDNGCIFSKGVAA